MTGWLNEWSCIAQLTSRPNHRVPQVLWKCVSTLQRIPDGGSSRLPINRQRNVTFIVSYFQPIKGFAGIQR